jgi:hypothetical protein
MKNSCLKWYHSNNDKNLFSNIDDSNNKILLEEINANSVFFQLEDGCFQLITIQEQFRFSGAAL